MSLAHDGVEIDPDYHAPAFIEHPTPMEVTNLELERSDAAGDAVAEPLVAWQAARRVIPPGDLVRRIAFARNGLFLFYSEPGGTAVENVFIRWQDEAYHPDLSARMEAVQFESPGVDPERVEPALQLLMQSNEWRLHAARMDSFFLEGFRERMVWVLMPVPEGGYQEGVAIPTYEVPFQ